MARKFLWLSLSVLVILWAAGAAALAAEAGLGGVKLDEQAVDLLKDAMLGQPQYIGPAGVSIGLVAAGTTPGAPRAAAPPVRRPVAPAPVFGGAAAAPVAPAGAQARAPAGAARTEPERQIRWLYARGGENLVAGLRPDGTVASIQVSGMFGFSKTARGIGLGSAYERLLSTYGFPDQTIHVGTVLVVRYLDHGLTFTLTNRAVDSIMLEAVPSPLAAPRAPTPVGVPTPQEEEEEDPYAGNSY